MDSAGFAVTGARSRTRSIAYVALCIALIAVSAWVVVPGPIPFTLQMFAVPFMIAVLTPKQAMATIFGYLLLGAIGVPVFSGMRGGFGVLMGPTGGFLWGYIFGVAAGAFFLRFVRMHTDWDEGRKKLARQTASDPVGTARIGFAAKVLRFFRMVGMEFIAGVLFTICAYICGCIQYMALMNVGMEVAFLTCCAPFIVLDLLKIAAAVLCAQSVRSALRI